MKGRLPSPPDWLMTSPHLILGALLVTALGVFIFMESRSAGTGTAGAPEAIPMATQNTPTQVPPEGRHSSSASTMREVAECPECYMVIPSNSTPSPEATATLQPPPTETPPPTPVPLAPPFEVPAGAVAILEAECGALLYGKEEHTSVAPASLTKIITALAVIDRVNLADTVVSDISARELKQRTRSSVMGLEPDMRVTVEDLLYGLFLPSGNDAAIMLAKHVSGSEDAFNTLMNETAQHLGLANSSFDNPHGLDSSGLRSTAYDMAVAGMALMRNPTLASIANARSYTLSGGLHFRNGNRLLEQFPGSYGVKIGHTRAAKYTIVGAAARENRHLFIAVMGSENLYGETGELLDWAFEQPSACKTWG